MEGEGNVAIEAEASALALHWPESRWVDGGEVDSEAPPVSYLSPEDGSGAGEGVTVLRRRLSRRAERVDSLDVEAMGIADDLKHGQKVIFLVCCTLRFFN